MLLLGVTSDLKCIFRRLSRHRKTTFLIVLCLALGTGGNSLVFSVVEATLLAPLPYPQADRIVAVSDTYQGQTYEVSPPNFAARRATARSFSAVAAMLRTDYSLATGDEPVRVEAAEVSHGLFEVLGVAPLVGRAFTSEEDLPSAPERVVLLGHKLWRDRFGGDRGVVGRSITLEGTGRTVLGVMPEGFDYPLGAELWVPLGVDPDAVPARQWHNLYMLARLEPGATVESAQAELDAIARSMEERHPETNRGWGAKVLSLREYLVGNQRATLIALQGAVAFFLLIVCFNVATLLLARAIGRSGEHALRSALGARRWDLVRQVLLEGLVLALLGGLLGLGLAAVMLEPVRSWVPADLGNIEAARLAMPVLLFTLALAVGCGLAAGILPALRATRSDPAQVLRTGLGRGTGTRGERWRQSSLVIAEVAIAVVLLVAAGSMFRSWQKLKDVETGFATDNLLTLQLSLPDAVYPGVEERTLFTRRLLDEVRSLPGVEAAGTTNVLPFDERPVQALFSVEGRPPREPGEVLITKHRLVSPGYLATLGLPIYGRDVTDLDDLGGLADGSGGVVIVSEALAQTYWPERDPLGRRVKRGAYDSENPWLTVIGVVPDLRDVSLEEEVAPTWYLPSGQHRFTYLRLAIRTESAPEALVPSIRQVVRSLDPQLPIHGIATMEDLISATVADRRFSTVLLAVFALMGLVLAQVGIYGLLSYSVANRQQELSVRMALGAAHGRVRRMVVGQGLKLAIVGMVIGVAGSLIAHRFLRHVLYEVGPADPITLFAVLLGVGAVAVLGSVLPASHACKATPAHLSSSPSP